MMQLNCDKCKKIIKEKDVNFSDGNFKLEILTEHGFDLCRKCKLIVAQGCSE